MCRKSARIPTHCPLDSAMAFIRFPSAWLQPLILSAFKNNLLLWSTSGLHAARSLPLFHARNAARIFGSSTVFISIPKSVQMQRTCANNQARSQTHGPTTSHSAKNKATPLHTALHLPYVSVLPGSVSRLKSWERVLTSNIIPWNSSPEAGEASEYRLMAKTRSHSLSARNSRRWASIPTMPARAAARRTVEPCGSRPVSRVPSWSEGASKSVAKPKPVENRDGCGEGAQTAGLSATSTDPHPRALALSPPRLLHPRR